MFSRFDRDIQKFAQVCESGNVNLLKELFSQPGFSVANVRDFHEYNAYNGFLEAAERGHLEIIKYLFDQGWTIKDIRRFNPGHTTASENSPLIQACYEGHLAIIQELFRYGMNLEDIRVNNCHALAAAFFKNHIEIVKELISRGLTKDDIRISTILEDADDNHNLEMIQLLVTTGEYTREEASGWDISDEMTDQLVFVDDVLVKIVTT